MLELRIANSEDAQDHLHAITCQREAKKGRAKSLGKSLNGHEETTGMQTQEYYVFKICNNVLHVIMKYNEGAPI